MDDDRDLLAEIDVLLHLLGEVGTVGRRVKQGILARRGRNDYGTGSGTPPNGGEVEETTLPSGGDLAAAINSAGSGDTIILEAGGTYNVDPGDLTVSQNLTIRGQDGAGERAYIRSGDGTGNWVIVKSKDGRWRWLPREGTDITSDGANPASINYVGPHLNTNGTVDLTTVSSAKTAGEDFNDWPDGADPADYDTMRGDGGEGFKCTGGTLTLQNLQVECYQDALNVAGGNIVVSNCVFLGARNGLDMNAGGDCTLTDCFFSGGTQNCWTWVEIKSGELDSAGKRTFCLVKDATGTLTIERCTVHDYFDGIVGNPSSLTLVMNQVTLEGRPDDLNQVEAGTHGDLTVSRVKCWGSAIAGSTSTTSPNTVTNIFEDSVVYNWRELYDYGNPRWRRLTNNHGDPVDPWTVRRCTFIERGGTNSNGVTINAVYGAMWYGSSARPQVWEDVCLVMATDSGKIGRDYDQASAGGLQVSGSAILNIDGGTLTFDNGGDFASWKAATDGTAELITDTGYTPDQLWSDPRLISGRFGRTVGAVPSNAISEFRDKDGEIIGDPNDWSAIETPSDVEGGGGGGGDAWADGTLWVDGTGWVP